MAKSIWIIFSCLLLSACERSGTNSIVGKWELSQEIGGIGGTNNFPPGYGQVAQFFADGTFKNFWYQSGHYTILRTGQTDGQDLLLSKDDYTGAVRQDSVRVADKQLFITDPFKCCDVINAYVYRKIGISLP
jgi:hypothetical protein